MCGIAGVFDRSNKYRPDRELLMSMADVLVHRGPDEAGCFVERNVGFGFRRLSIIDLAGGAQPMFNEDRTVVLVCNGEIYNYREIRRSLVDLGHIFSSDCDVEVILHLYEEYGAALVGKLNGQFSFCLYDISRQLFLLARDHVGIAPLFYTMTDNVFVFASEIKAILKHPAVRSKVNLTGLDQILSFPGNVSPVTMFEGIHSLPPGHYLSLDMKRMEIKEYWDLDYPREDMIEYRQDEAYYTGRLTELLKKAVSDRLQSDVPLGFYLSGGLDSSLIAAMITELSPGEQRHSFSIGFPDVDLDEGKYRQLMLPVTKSIHHELRFEKEDIVSRLRQAVYHAEAPLKESYNTCSLALSEEVRRNGIKVVLTGEGADELFAGYVGYRFDRLRKKEKVSGYGYEEEMESEIREKLWGIPHFLYEKNYHEFQDVKQSLYSKKMNDCFASFDSVRENIVNKKRLCGLNEVHVRSYIDFKLRLSDHLVADHGDRVSYANSIEARYPFLDVDLIEFVTKIPPDLKLHQLVEKHILKKCAQPYLPKQIIEREKFSFVAPGSHYLLQSKIDWIEHLLSYETISRQGYFDPGAVERLKKLYRSDQFRLNQTFETDLLMIVLTFGIFLDLFQLDNL
jgi:asparagine synthase (glutamine-hydrolysing)